jgi:hypothetical protein
MSSLFRRNAATLLIALVALGSGACWGADPGAWLPPIKMVMPRSPASVTLLTDGTVLVAGGGGVKKGTFADLETAEMFDPQTNAFTATGPMHFTRFNHSAVRLLDGRVLIVGGSWEAKSAAAELFDPTTKTFSLAGALPWVGAGMSATLLLDGRVLIAGGGDLGNNNSALARSLLFDPATGQFIATGALTVSRIGHAAVRLADGKVVILGGVDDKDPAATRVEVYDPVTGAFSAQGTLTTPRANPTATLLSDSKILITGGYQSNAKNPKAAPVVLDSVEIYDPATGHSQIAGAMSVPRWEHQAIALPDGRVLLAGGFTNLSSLAITRTVDLFDPATGQITPGPPMATAHGQGAAVLLQDGRAIVFSGIGSASGFNSRAEIYQPPTDAAPGG